mgnify:CR=1 FL=1
MLKNKHLIIALIVAPILAVLAYFATDMLVAEEPTLAKQGSKYRLVAHPSCRYESGRCVLQNGNFKLHITGESFDDGRLIISMRSEFPLEQANVSVVRSVDEVKGPSVMQSVDNDLSQWRLQVQAVNPNEQIMRVAVMADGAVYYGETTMPFLKYQTSFNKDFRD